MFDALLVFLAFFNILQKKFYFQQTTWDTANPNATVSGIPSIETKADWSNITPNNRWGIGAAAGGQWPVQTGGSSDWGHPRHDAAPWGSSGQPHPAALVPGVPSGSWGPGQPGLPVAVDQVFSFHDVYS